MDKIKINPLVYPLATKGLITNVTKNNLIRFSQSELNNERLEKLHISIVDNT